MTPLLWLGAALLLAALTLPLDALLSRQPGPNVVLDAPLQLDGFDAPERSDTLPTPAGAATRTFRWSRAQAALTIAPSLAGSGRLALEYLNPAADRAVALTIGQATVSVPPTTTLRKLVVLLPPRADTLRIDQRGAVASGDRALGMIVSDARWLMLGGAGNLAGLPLSVALVTLLIGTLGRGRRAAWIGLPIVLAALALLAIRASWSARLLQATLQIVLACGLIGALAALALRRPIRRWPVIIVAAWAISTLLLFTPRISTDGTGYYAWLRSAAIDGDLRFDNELDPAISPLPNTPPLITLRTPTGYVPNPWSVGPAIVWAPAWWLAHGIALIGRALGAGWRADGYDPPYLALVTLVSALGGLATMLGCYAIGRRWFSRATAALAAIGLYLGSNLLFYAQLEGGFAHSLSAAAATALIWATLALESQPTPRRWIGLGLAAGATVLIYWITAIVLIAPGLLVLGMLWRSRRDERALLAIGRGAIVAGMVAALVVLPQILAWRLIYGSWIATPQGAEFITPRALHLRQILIGTPYGLPWWTPAYVAGLLGAVWFAIRRPWPGLALLLAALGYIVYNATLPDWHGSGAFGMRRLTALAPILAIGLGALIEPLRARRTAIGALMGVIAGWSIVMTARYLVFQLPHDPLVLIDLRVRDELWTTWPDVIAALRRVLGTTLLAGWLRQPSLGGTLTLIGCALALLIVSAGWSVWSRRRIAASG